VNTKSLIVQKEYWPYILEALKVKF
jgi:hypothetical protein